MKYHEQLKNPLWQKKRLEVLESYGFQCQECHSKEDTLHVHHPIYKRGAMIWDYSDSELQCLCEKCHKEAHALDEQLKKSTAYLNNDQKKKVLGYSDSHHSPMQNAETFYVDGYIDSMRTNTKWLAYLMGVK